MDYDVLIIGAGPGGIFTAYELNRGRKKPVRTAVLEQGLPLARRKCPMAAGTVPSCRHCRVCSVMSGFGGAGAFSDGKYNISFSGSFHDLVGKERATGLMRYVDGVLQKYGAEGTRLYPTVNGPMREMCLRAGLQPLDAEVRHLGTDRNRVVLENLYRELEGRTDFCFSAPVAGVDRIPGGFRLTLEDGRTMTAARCVIAAGRSGSKWMEEVCRSLEIPTLSNRVDLGVRVELPARVLKRLTDELYEIKLAYKVPKSGDTVRTFCMNPRGAVISENTSGLLTVNGHSYEDPSKATENTNFALLVSRQIPKPFSDSNRYLEGIARLGGLMGGVVVQRFGDLVQGRPSTERAIAACSTRPTLRAVPGDLGLMIPGRFLEDITEMLYALDQIAPGTADGDTLLYGVEVKYYNMRVELDKSLETRLPGLYVIGDCGGISHSLSQACAGGVLVGRQLRKLYPENEAGETERPGPRRWHVPENAAGETERPGPRSGRGEKETLRK